MTAVTASIILQEARRLAGERIESRRGADALLDGLHPTPEALAEAYVVQVRRIHHKQTSGPAAVAALRILEAACDRQRTVAA